ncbi:MAG: DUF6455 family protein [Pararhodobacter sp.]
MGFIEKLDHHTGLIGTMAETVHADLGKALETGRLSGPDLRSAVLSCMRCEGAGECEGWLAEHKDGAADTPAYCRNGDMMRRLQRA